MRGQFGRSLGRFALLAVGIAVAGLVAGWFFGKGQPRAAAGALISDFVVVEPMTGNEAAAADPDLVAPTSGQHLGTAQCGFFVENVSNDALLASLAVGIVAVLHGPDLSEAELAELQDFADGRDRVLVAFEPRLTVPVVALSWAHRMPLRDANLELLTAFHTARVGIAPNSRPSENPCSP